MRLSALCLRSKLISKVRLVFNIDVLYSFPACQGARIRGIGVYDIETAIAIYLKFDLILAFK